MRTIHDPDKIVSILKGKAAWLMSVEYCPQDAHSFHPIVSALVRIEEEYKNLSLMPDQGILVNLRRLQEEAALIYSNHVELRRSHVDAYEHAQNVMQRERTALGYRDRLKACLSTIEKHVGHEVIWCMTFADADIHWRQQKLFLDALYRFNFPNMMIFLIRDGATEFFENFEKPNTIIALDQQEWYDLVAEVRKTMPAPKCPDPPGGIHTDDGTYVYEQSEDQFDPWDDEEKPKPKKYRSLDDA